MAFGVTQAAAASLENGTIAFVRRDHATAASIVYLADRGNSRAQASLGFMYANGQGVPQNYGEAAVWYARSAAQGNPTGQYFLGLLYDKGFGVPPDDILAYKWLNLAVAGARPSEREYWRKIRDAVAAKLTRSELAEAQWLALRWRPIRER